LVQLPHDIEKHNSSPNAQVEPFNDSRSAKEKMVDLLAKHQTLLKILFWILYQILIAVEYDVFVFDSTSQLKYLIQYDTSKIEIAEQDF
jgi:hypothetical protein